MPRKMVSQQKWCLKRSLVVLHLLTLAASTSYAGAVWKCREWSGDRVSRPARLQEYCFVYTNQDFELTWEDAASYCSGHRGILAMDYKDEIFDFLTDLLAKERQEGQQLCFWIGLTDTGKAGSWRWSNGDAVFNNRWGWKNNFMSWLTSLTYDCGQLCADGLAIHLKGGDIWAWLKAKCSQKRRAICQYDATAVEVAPKDTPRDIKPASVKPKKNPEVKFIRVSGMENFRLSPRAIFSEKRFTVVSCARLCQASPHCRVINYNYTLRRCLGFSTWSLGDAVPKKGWGVWELLV